MLFQTFQRAGEFIGATIGSLFSAEYWKGITQIVGGSLVAAVDLLFRHWMAVFAGMKSTFLLLGSLFANALIGALIKFTSFLEKFPGASLLLGDLPETLKDASKGLEGVISKNNPLKAMEEEYTKDTKLGKIAQDLITEGVKTIEPFADELSKVFRPLETLDFGKMFEPSDSSGKSSDDGSSASKQTDSGKGELPQFRGLDDLYRMQRDKEGGIGVGTRTMNTDSAANRAGIGARGLSSTKFGSGFESSFSRVRKGLGVASSSVTGGIGEKRRLNTSKDDKDAKKALSLEEQSLNRLEGIEKGINQALTVQ
jgi:hypothetical protein